MRNTRKILSLLTLGFSLSSCGKDISTPFQDPTVPVGNLDDALKGVGASSNNQRGTRYCLEAEDGSFKEELKTSRGRTKDYAWGEGGSCLLLDIREVWARSMNPSAMAWDAKSTLTQQGKNIPQGSVQFFNMHYEASKYFITVEWDMAWVHTLLEGSIQNPEKILINYKKVKGTSHLPYWEGSILLTSVDRGVTSFSLRDQVKSARTDENSAEATVHDVFNKLKKAAPAWESLPR